MPFLLRHGKLSRILQQVLLGRRRKSKSILKIRIIMDFLGPLVKSLKVGRKPEKSVTC
jgi:hypothetical protein